VSARRGESGYALVALLAMAAVMLILLSAAGPYWKYLMHNDREEELLARGGEIADAIARYQRKNGNALPSSLDVLVKQHFLRRAYKDPMTKDGKWRFLRPGDALLPGAPGAPAQAGAGASGLGGTGFGGVAPATTTTTTRPSAFSQPGQGIGQGFQGVATTNGDKSLRVFNGRTKYNEWLFVAGQPRLIGRAPTTSPRPGAVQPGSTQPGAAQPGTSPPAGATYTPR
jgi:type II secretory pathway pseudopilin PulG